LQKRHYYLLDGDGGKKGGELFETGKYKENGEGPGKSSKQVVTIPGSQRRRVLEEEKKVGIFERDIKKRIP